MPGTIVYTGEAAAISSDVRSIADNLAAGTANGGDLAAAANAAASIANVLAANPLTSAIAQTAAGLQLAAEQAKLQAAITSKDNDAIVDSILGIIGAGGGIIAMLPTPQSKAIGVGIAVTAAAAKDIYKNRQSISDAIDEVRRRAIEAELEWRARPMPIWTSPQDAIDRGLIDPKTLLPRLNLDVNARWQLARTPTRRDPLAIDLDGDGIETLGIPTTGNPVVFDHDADGVKTGTGWVKPDDAWLVLDRNGNGTIDSGRELFGVDTLITVTEAAFGSSVVQTYNRNARSGFEALADRKSVV